MLRFHNTLTNKVEDFQPLKDNEVRMYICGPTVWNFVNHNGKASLPVAGEFSVAVDGKSDAVKAVGFKRRVLYAPLKARDLRIGNYLYLQLATPVADGQSVTVIVSEHGKKSASEAIAFVTDLKKRGRYQADVY